MILENAAVDYTMSKLRHCASYTADITERLQRLRRWQAYRMFQSSTFYCCLFLVWPLLLSHLALDMEEILYSWPPLPDLIAAKVKLLIVLHTTYSSKYSGPIIEYYITEVQRATLLRWVMMMMMIYNYKLL